MLAACAPSTPNARRPRSPPSHQLEKVLGLFSVVAIVVGQVIGSGIFFKPQVVAQQTGGFVGLILALWIVCGLVNLCGALAMAELAAMFPQAGGTYVFLRETYGPLWSFLWAWAEFWVIRTGAIAALAAYLAVARERAGADQSGSPAGFELDGRLDQSKGDRRRRDRAAGRDQHPRTSWAGAVQNVATLDQGGLRGVSGGAAVHRLAAEPVEMGPLLPGIGRPGAGARASARPWPRSCGPTTAGAT